MRAWAMVGDFADRSIIEIAGGADGMVCVTAAAASEVFFDVVINW